MSDETLAALYEIANHVSKGDTVDETLASAVEFATALVNCDDCCTYVRQGSQLVPWVWKHSQRGSLEPVPLRVEDGIARTLATHRVPIAVDEDSVKGSTFRVFDDWSNNPGETFICVPFMSRSQLVGAITLHHGQAHPYQRHELKLLSSIASLLGADLGIAQLENENAELRLELETRKLAERRPGDRWRERGMSESEADLALERQRHLKRRSLKDIAEAIMVEAEVKQKVAPME
jgi:uroporphyrinogen-III synthase